VIDLERALIDFTQIFDRLHIPYAVMGGIAVRVYGIPRATYDVDLTIAIDRDRLPDLYKAIQDIGYTIPEAFEKGWIDQVGGMALVKARLYLQGRGVDIDMFLAESRYQLEILNRRKHGLIDNVPTWFVSPEDLIVLKLLANRPRDIADIGDILFTQGQLDEEYMRKWADSLGLLEMLNKLLRENPPV
jgi:hypothetical protein